MNETAQYVADFLKRHDHDRYLSTLILPEKHRDAVQALFAFSADVAAIPARVSEPGPGEIRLQWWKDALEGVGHSGGNQNPLASALMQTIETYELPIKQLVRLIAARRFDLYQDPMPDMPTFEGYAGETNSTLYQFAAIILNDGASVENGDAAGHLGVAHALVGHVAALGHNAARGRIYLPQSLFNAHSVSEQSLLAGQGGDALSAAITQILELAAGHMQKADIAIAELPKVARPAFAMIAIVHAQLRLLRKSTTSFPTLAGPADWQKIISLIWWALRKA